MMDGKKSNSMANRIEAMMLANQMIDNERKFNQFIKEKQDNAILQLAMVAFGIRDAVIVFTQGGGVVYVNGDRGNLAYRVHSNDVYPIVEVRLRDFIAPIPGRDGLFYHITFGFYSGVVYVRVHSDPLLGEYVISIVQKSDE